MIEQGQPYTFCFNNAQRDFKPRSEELFLLQCEVDETEWHYLKDFPTDAIGAVTLRFDDLPDSVSLGFEAFRRFHRTPATGEMFFVELVLVSQVDWLRFLPKYRFQLGEATILWNSRAAKEKRPPKAKEPTPYGAFWCELDGRGFHNRPDVREWLNHYENSEDGAKDALRRKLGVTKRSLEASPDVLLCALEAAGDMAGAITAVQVAAAKTR